MCICDNLCKALPCGFIINGTENGGPIYKKIRNSLIALSFALGKFTFSNAAGYN